MTDQIHDLTLQQSTLSAQRQTSRQLIRTLDSKISDVQNSLDSLSIDEADIAMLKTQMQETSRALEAAQEEFTQKSWDSKISSIEIQISTIEEELRSVQTELTSTSAQSEFRAKIDVLKADLAKKTQARSHAISSHAERFKNLVGAELTATTADSQINVLFRRKADDLEDAERVSEGASKEITQYEAKLTASKEQLRDKRKEKNEAYSKVMEICEVEIDEFPDIVKRLEEEVGSMKLYAS